MEPWELDEEEPPQTVMAREWSSTRDAWEAQRLPVHMAEERFGPVARLMPASGVYVFPPGPEPGERERQVAAVYEAVPVIERETGFGRLGDTDAVRGAIDQAGLPGPQGEIWMLDRGALHSAPLPEELATRLAAARTQADLVEGLDQYALGLEPEAQVSGAEHRARDPQTVAQLIEAGDDWWDIQREEGNRAHDLPGPGGDPAAADRPFRHLSDEQLTMETFSAEMNVGAAERRIDQRLDVIAGWEAQAASLDQRATSVAWERPAWTQVALDRQAETAAAARLAALEETLGRGVVQSALRGGPRGNERQQLQAESAQLRAARPEVAVGADRSAMWARRAETAWADDKAAYKGLRAGAEDLRGKAAAARDSLPRLGDSRLAAESRLDQLGAERRHRLAEPVAVRRNETAPTIEGPGATPAGPGVQAGPARQTAGSIDPGAPAQAQLDGERSRSNQLAR